MLGSRDERIVAEMHIVCQLSEETRAQFSSGAGFRENSRWRRKMAQNNYPNDVVGSLSEKEQRDADKDVKISVYLRPNSQKIDFSDSRWLTSRPQSEMLPIACAS